MPGSRVRVPPLLSTSQSLTGGWLESLSGGAPICAPISSRFSAGVSSFAAIFSQRSRSSTDGDGAGLTRLDDHDALARLPIGPDCGRAARRESACRGAPRRTAMPSRRHERRDRGCALLCRVHAPPGERYLRQTRCMRARPIFRRPRRTKARRAHDTAATPHGRSFGRHEVQAPRPDGHGRHNLEGLHYFSMAFSLIVEILNLRAKAKHGPPVKLHQSALRTALYCSSIASGANGLEP